MHALLDPDPWGNRPGSGAKLCFYRPGEMSGVSGQVSSFGTLIRWGMP